ncbi:MAG: DUF11 domain-containing protein [archaeon]|nr:DUF11 domain-containing protein [archaeon]
MSNIGEGNATDFIVIDYLPKGLIVDNTSLVNTPEYTVVYDAVNRVITWTVFDIPVGSDIDLIYNVTVNAYGRLNNTVELVLIRLI